MPQYASDVSNEELSNASKSLHEVGIEVYNVDGSFRDLDVILGELSAKWDTLSDAQQSNISYNVAATRQSSKFKNILTAWSDAMSLATEATNSQGNALENQAKYEESFTGKITKIKAQMDEFWLSFYDSAGTKNILDFVINLTEAFTDLAQTVGPIKTLVATIVGLSFGKNGLSQLFKFFKSGGLSNAVAQPNPGCYSRYNLWGCYCKENHIMAWQSMQ